MKEMYPKLHMFMKANRIFQEKQGKSDFEIYAGVSEMVSARSPVGPEEKKHILEPKIFNLE